MLPARTAYIETDQAPQAIPCNAKPRYRHSSFTQAETSRGKDYQANEDKVFWLGGLRVWSRLMLLS